MKEYNFSFLLIVKLLKSLLTLKSFILLKLKLEQNIGLQRTFNTKKCINDTITPYTIS